MAPDELDRRRSRRENWKNRDRGVPSSRGGDKHSKQSDQDGGKRATKPANEKYGDGKRKST